MSQVEFKGFLESENETFSPYKETIVCPKTSRDSNKKYNFAFSGRNKKAILTPSSNSN
jgi:hypothetical protein